MAKRKNQNGGRGTNDALGKLAMIPLALIPLAMGAAFMSGSGRSKNKRKRGGNASVVKF